MRINEEALEIVASVTLAEALSAILDDKTPKNREPSSPRADRITQPICVV